MSNVIDFRSRRAVAVSKKYSYDHLDKLELMEEMIRFQEERAQRGGLTPEMIDRGIVLFKALAEAAETQELRILCSSYRKHLIEEQGATG